MSTAPPILMNINIFKTAIILPIGQNWPRMESWNIFWPPMKGYGHTRWGVHRTKSLSVSHLTILFPWSPCGLRIYTMESMDRWREIFSLACLITCISQLEGENFPDNWCMIILEVRSRIIRVWYYLGCNIPRQYFQNRVAIQHSFESSKKDDTWFISKNQMQTNGRTSSPVYVSVVNSIKALSLGALPAE